MNATLRIPLLRAIGFPVLGMALAFVFFASGWFMRYSMKHGVGGATGLFAQRLFDALAAPPAPKPDPVDSTRSTTSTTSTTGVAHPAGASPTRRPPPPPIEVTVYSEVAQLIGSLTELQQADRITLKGKVKLWKNAGPNEIIGLAEELDKRFYLKDPVRRGILFKLLALQTVMPMFKIPLDKQEEAERIAKGWEVSDIRSVFNKLGVAGVKKMAAGRPYTFFLELKKKWGPYQQCRDNLQALKEGKARPPAETPSRNATPGDTSGPPILECPAGGQYTSRGKGVWACSIHQTLEQPFADAARLQWYIEPVEEAIKTAKMGQLEQATANLSEVLRLHPNHIWAVDAMNEMLADGKAWPGLRTHLERFIGKDPVNVRWGYLLAKASHEQLDFDAARRYASRALNASFNTAPPNVLRMQDFFILRDRAKEIWSAAGDKNRPEEYPWRKDEDQPSQLCVRNLTEVRTAVQTFVKGYPNTHPALISLREKAKLAQEMLAKTPPGPKADAIKAKAKAIEDRISLIASDTTGKLMWKALVKYLAGYQINSCPDGGRYTLERHQWLDCSKHQGILGERLEWESRTPPNPDEEVQLSRALLKGALAADPKRRACFDAQRAYVASRGAEGVQPGEITTATKLPTGEPLSCPSGKIEAVATGATTARVRCSYHGSYEEYFEGVGELKEEK